jgi:hypothetical protein
MPVSAKAQTRPPSEWPIYWFAKLEKAVETGDHEAAAEAQRRLDQLGVHVQYGRPVQPKELPHV